MIQEIKDLRVRLDGLAQLTKGLKGDRPDKTDEILYGKNFEGFPTEESKEAYNSLRLAKTWLGKILGEIGETTPYKNDGNRKTVKDIEPVADRAHLVIYEEVADWEKEVWNKSTHIEKVDWLREEVKDIIDNTANFSANVPHIELEQGFVYKYLCEARFWLGFELQRVKEQL